LTPSSHFEGTLYERQYSAATATLEHDVWLDVTALGYSTVVGCRAHIIIIIIYSLLLFINIIIIIH
jgi:hypothetical protein